MKNNRNLGFWILIGFGILLNLNYLMGQTMALINYGFAESIGLQESASEITEVGIALNKGFGLGDTVFYMPIFILGIKFDRLFIVFYRQFFITIFHICFSQTIIGIKGIGIRFHIQIKYFNGIIYSIICH